MGEGASSANDYSRIGAVTQDTTHDYAAYMRYCSDPANWFQRARGEWTEPDRAVSDGA